MVTAAMKLKDACSLEEKLCRQHIKKQRHYFTNKGPSSQSMVFPVVMYRCESWTIEKASTEELMLLNDGVGEDFESPLDCKEIQPVNPKGNQS